MRKPKIVARHRIKCVDYRYFPETADEAARVSCRLEITAGERKGETIWYNGKLTEKGQTHVANALLALGMRNDDLAAPVGIPGDVEAIAVERENTYPGAKNPTRIDFIDPLPADGPPPARETTRSAAKFKALFRRTDDNTPV